MKDTRRIELRYFGPSSELQRAAEERARNQTRMAHWVMKASTVSGLGYTPDFPTPIRRVK